MKARILLTMCLIILAIALWYSPWHEETLQERALSAESAEEVFSGRDYSPPKSPSSKEVRKILKNMPPGPSIVIPTIGVQTELDPITRNEDNVLKAPDNYKKAGLWIEGPIPGDSGAAIISGHIDSVDAPGVFWHLRSLEKGDKIYFTDYEGYEFVFEVYAREQYPKPESPPEIIYPDTEEKLLTLITCGGDFDYSTGHYLDNVVVFSRLIKSPSFYFRYSPTEYSE